MASIPARQSSQRRSAQEPEAPPITSTSRSPVRGRSEEPQTIFVQKEDNDRTTDGELQAGTNRAPPNVDDDPTVKKCWICFSDSTEDTPETSPWRDPCPCALVAHEDCLLDWIADIEAPKRNRTSPIGSPKIECPQCKAEIRLARPKDYLVSMFRGVEKLGAKIITPGAMLTLSGVVWSSSAAWGIHSIYAVFGSEDGFRILRPLIENATRPPVEVYAGDPALAGQQLLRVVLDHLRHWRLYIGLPLITPVLILSRTSFADGVLPVLPIVFFASQSHSSSETLDFAQWPPSASFAFAMLPYVRSLYNLYYQKTWAQREIRWLNEIQPRSGQGQEGAANDQDGGLDPDVPRQPADDENVFEVRIDGGMWEEWDDDAQQAAGAPNEQVAPQPQQQPVENGAAAPQQQLERADGQRQRARQNQPQGERRLSFSPTAIAETIVGALVFPTIAGLSGELLKLLLPAAWTATPTPSARFSSKLAARGLLQQKWGRSLVGGCLFVVCKDALTLYVRWKIAQMHRSRRVVDYDRRAENARK